MGDAAPPGWRDVDGQTLERTYVFPDWRAAIAFVNRVSDLAEAAQHHPDLAVSWGRVHVVLTTHDAGHRVTEKDRALARAIDA